jgi:hypothetical protein
LIHCSNIHDIGILGRTYLQNKRNGPLWSWLFGSLIYNYLCNQYLSHKSPTNTYSCIEWTLTRVGFELITLVVISTDCIGSCKSNYQTITTTTAHFSYFADMFVPKYQYHEYCYSESNIFMNPSRLCTR